MKEANRILSLGNSDFAFAQHFGAFLRRCHCRGIMIENRRGAQIIFEGAGTIVLRFLHLSRNIERAAEGKPVRERNVLLLQRILASSIANNVTAASTTMSREPKGSKASLLAAACEPMATSSAEVNQIRSPTTIGEDHPFPGITVFQTGSRNELPHFEGTLFSTIRPAFGPRNCHQSSAIPNSPLSNQNQQ